VIPRRLVRTVPTTVDSEQERLWHQACRLHPDWEHVTWRDPVDPKAFPITSPHWGECESGAQLADLIRAEDLWHRGGIYIDSDVEMLRPFDPLCGAEGFAAWEDHLYIPNAVMGCRPGHPAMRKVVELAVANRNCGTWHAGVGVTTKVFRSRDDMLLLPPGAFYPVHWKDAHKGLVNWQDAARANPWAFCLHRYKASWH
jgi:mannosyltransferase OCH1-like enzyme